MPAIFNNLGAVGALMGSVFDTSVPESKVRLNGLILGGIGLGFLVLNLITIFVLNRYYFLLAALMPVCICSGGYLIILGRPLDAQTGLPAGWWKVGFGIVSIGSLVVGVVLSWWLGTG